ncbi:universal stress protein [Chachezhania antarctica]|uniref:universal stress protein n=1 Tax=Chachezhania antarctica TaxID=2340860 RepID=UPI000EB40D6F|nr:universal stress protein [Chachezhania antarctica]|tara:strand:+ start:3327 stop:4166 length:840 start_codon:yes stop_codon:yes gene_type:complete
MAYKSLLTVLTDIRNAAAPLAHVTELAAAWDAHAEALCLGVDRSQVGYYYAGANAMVVQESLTRTQTEAEEIQAHAEDVLGRSDARWSVGHGVCQLVDIARHVAYRARFSDLVLLPKPYGDGCGVELEAVVEAALFDSRAAVLITPPDSTPVTAPGTVLLAWNESDEAIVAARRALPLLQTAQNVRIVVVDPSPHGPERSDPGGMLSQMLARHGVKCEIDVLSKTLPRVSDVLVRHCIDSDADLLVMGAYGRSRLREAILGGSTRSMLEMATIPVFMAH